ncbi:MAG: dipeptidase PepE [Cyclobacteriaceae bacterium]|jgi:dipeptidase E|nr:dipeptidase PepE [Cytophagales bacterium]MCZ8328871.1 dipeptidase PepE [Cyclobacteriaceae bacterium]
MQLLLLSNSTMPGTPYFAWPKPYVSQFLKSKGIKSVVFFPYAAVTFSMDEYTKLAQDAFASIGFNLTSIHTANHPEKLLMQAECIVVGGGNTFALLHRLYQSGLISLIKEKIAQQTPYIGWSAGANLACPTIRTTNDMPIVQPASFQALNLIPFQINPHYHELSIAGQGGETRIERLQEFITFNPQTNVLGLPEGMLLERDNDKLLLKGKGEAKLYQHQNNVITIQEGDVSYLMR